jgi:hypothetical protein
LTLIERIVQGVRSASGYIDNEDAVMEDIQKVASPAIKPWRKREPLQEFRVILVHYFGTPIIKRLLLSCTEKVWVYKPTEVVSEGKVLKIIVRKYIH